MMARLHRPKSVVTSLRFRMASICCTVRMVFGSALGFLGNSRSAAGLCSRWFCRTSQRHQAVIALSKPSWAMTESGAPLLFLCWCKWRW